MGDSKYTKIRLNSLHPSVPVPFDIYVKINDRHILYLRAGDAMNADKIQSFEVKAPDSFFILENYYAAYKKHISEQMDSAKLTSKDKAVILRESSLALVEELYENPDIDQALTDSKGIITDFIDFMETDPEAMGHLIGLSSHDFYTYNHSLDVGIYSLGLAYVIGYRDEELKEMGQGALFHDIGKRHVDVNIICKDGPLDDNEWAQMQQHPQFGLLILDKHKATDAIKACAFEHHESFTGNGYPQKLAGDEIHPMARIVAITDTYDALTTKRSYNEPMTPTNALSFMDEKLRSRYDARLMDAMKDVLFKMAEAKKSEESA